MNNRRNSANLVSKYVLRNKIKEYFKKNPKAKGFVADVNLGESKVFWKVEKRGKSFHVTEVKTLREEFMMEAGESPFKTQGTFGGKNFSVTAQDLVNLVSDPQIARAGKSTAQRNRGKSTSDFSVGASSLASMPQAEFEQMKSQLLKQLGFSGPATPGRSRSLGEAPEDKGKKPEEPMRDPKDPEDPRNPTLPGVEDPGPEVSPDAAAAGEIDPGQAAQQKGKPEDVVRDDLSGQTVEKAEMMVKPEGAELVLNVVGTKNPTTIKFSKDGSVTYSHMGRSQVFRPSSSSGPMTPTGPETSPEKKKERK